MRERLLSPRSDRVLLVNNHRGGGIGDFGLTLQSELGAHLKNLQVEETSLDGRKAFRQAAKIARHQGALIANLGLTAWGRSGLRNFTGFTAVGLHRQLRQPTRVIVHHAIEIFDPAETGYEVSPLVRFGAHQALRRVKDCDLTVFSPRLLRILSRDYEAQDVQLTPLPGHATRQIATPPSGERCKVLSAGYWAPYKGIEVFVGVASKLRGRADFTLIGRPHSGLISDARFQHQVKRWIEAAIGAGVRLPGYLSKEAFDNECRGYSLGVLPYTSVSGASASFQLFAERGVPVVASDLPEFQYLKECGAGIALASPSAEGIEAAVEKVMDDANLWKTLARKQMDFNERYSWGAFTKDILKDLT